MRRQKVTPFHGYASTQYLTYSEGGSWLYHILSILSLHVTVSQDLCPASSTDPKSFHCIKGVFFNGLAFLKGHTPK